MAEHATLTGMHEVVDRPAIRKIGPADLRDALTRGIADFRANPSHLVFLTIIYPIVALAVTRLAFGSNLLPLLFPMLAGFTLIGPFAAIGMYELSRRREMSEDVSWRAALAVFRSPAIGGIAALTLLLATIFAVWLAVAYAIYQATMGEAVPQTLAGFIGPILGTDQGRMLIIIGNGAGLIFAIFVLAISVVSFPMLIDRNVGAAVAMQTSVRAFMANPVTILIWGLIVAVLLAVGMLPAFVGLAVVLPVLGHATWHLYRKLVAR